MKTVTLELDGSPLVDSLSLIASRLTQQEEVRVDDAWLAHHGCRAKPYARFREVLEGELDAAGASRRALRERRTVRVLLAVCRKPLMLTDLQLSDARVVCFSRVTDR
jgi:hypothetical protein